MSNMERHWCDRACEVHKFLDTSKQRSPCFSTNNAPHEGADTLRVADEASAPVLHPDWSGKWETELNSEAKVGHYGSTALLRTLTPEFSTELSVERTLSPLVVIGNSTLIPSSDSGS